jgi:hypothetical protein
VIIAARIDHEGDRIIPRRRAGRIGARDHPVADRDITGAQAVDDTVGMAAVFSRLWPAQRVAEGIIGCLSIAIGMVYDQGGHSKGGIVPKPIPRT